MITSTHLNQAWLRAEHHSVLSHRLYLYLKVDNQDQESESSSTQWHDLLKASPFSEHLLAQSALTVHSTSVSAWRLESDKQRDALSDQLLHLIKELNTTLKQAPRLIITSKPLSELITNSLETFSDALNTWFALLEEGELVTDEPLSELFISSSSSKAFSFIEQLTLQSDYTYDIFEWFIFKLDEYYSSEITPSVSQMYVGRDLERAYVDSILRRLSNHEVISPPILEIQGSAGMGKSTFLASIIPLIEQRELKLFRTLCVDFVSADLKSPRVTLAQALLEECRVLYQKIHHPAADPSSDSDFTHPTMTRSLITWSMNQKLIPQDTPLFILLDLLGVPLLAEEQSALSHYLERDLWQKRSELLSQWLRVLSCQQGICLVIEDAHWIDEEFSLFLKILATSLAPSLTNESLLVIVTTRPNSKLYTQIPEFEELSTRIELKPLSLSESRALARDLTLGQRLPWQVDSPQFANREWIEQCVLEAEGHPLLLTHLLRSVPNLEASTQTHTLDDLLMTRYHQLTEESRQFLTFAACVGRIFNPERLPIKASLEVVLQETRTAQLIEPEEELWQFTHALVRDAIYGSLSDQERATSHLMIADTHHDHLSLRAEHLALAEDPQALSAYLQAGEEKEEMYQPHAALALYERALSLKLTASEKIEVLCRQGWLFEQLGDGRSCSHYFNEAYTYYSMGESKENSHDSSRILELILGRLASQRLLGDLLRAEQSVRELNQLISTQRFVLPLFKARFAYYRGSIAFSKGELTLCHQSHLEAIHQIEGLHSIGHQRVMSTYAQAWSGCGDALYAQGNFREAEKAMRRAVELAREYRLGRVEVSTLHMLAIVTTYLGEAQDGLELAHQCYQLAMSVNDARAMLFAELNMVLPMLWAGQASEALSYCHNAAQRVERMGSNILLGMSKAFLAYTLWWAGEHELARTYSEVALHISTQQGTRLFGGVALGAALLCLETSPDEQRVWIDRGLELLAEDVISHNYLYFTLGASIVLFELQDRDRLIKLEQTLTRFFNTTSQKTHSMKECVQLTLAWVDLLNTALNSSTSVKPLQSILKSTSSWSDAGIKLFAQMANLLNTRVIL